MPVTFTVQNIPITFPFEPYGVQKDFMGKVIECLETKSHAMLESPTGTGKTLSLLCSTLAWLTTITEEGNRSKAQDGESVLGQQPQIIYSSRTHTQLSQAMAQLRQSHYAFVNAAILGSRDQLCVNSSIRSESGPGAKVTKCRSLVKKGSCLYYSNIESTKSDNIFNEEILDIEDLVRVGEKLCTCPFYMSRHLKNQADIVFMPYNYLLDFSLRKQLDINLENCVVILDEGHNINKICEDSASFELSWSDVTECLEDLSQILQAMSRINRDASERPPFASFDLHFLIINMSALQKAVDEIPVNQKDKTAKFGGSHVFEFLKQADIHHGNVEHLRNLLTRITEWISMNDDVGLQHIGAGLKRLLLFLQLMFYTSNYSVEEHKKQVAESYVMYVTLESKSRNEMRLTNERKAVKQDAKVVNFWCLNPAFGMRALLDEGVQSVIITSGTLSPLNQLIEELGIPVNVTLESSHVVTKEQFLVGVVQNGPDKHSLNSSFRTRNDPAYPQSLGRTIQNVARLIPYGLLVFFPSYAVMDKCIDAWRATELWAAINKIKPICVEPRNKGELKEVMNQFYTINSQPASSGACFFAVLRGKVSEGLDFIDHNGRGVIVTGLPYPPLLDPRVVMKKAYLNGNKKKMTGDQWYQLEATRAVNQAIGRVIRHKNDYGVILFCDTRFSARGIRKDLSCWLRDQVHVFENFSKLPRPLAVFFKNAQQKLPQPEMKPVIIDCLDDSDAEVAVGFSNTDSAEQYMEKRYSGRFAQRYQQDYLHNKFAWLDKRRRARPTPYDRMRYPNKVHSHTSPGTPTQENMVTQSVADTPHPARSSTVTSTHQNMVTQPIPDPNLVANACAGCSTVIGTQVLKDSPTYGNMSTDVLPVSDLSGSTDLLVDDNSPTQPALTNAMVPPTGTSGTVVTEPVSALSLGADASVGSLFCESATSPMIIDLCSPERP